MNMNQYSTDIYWEKRFSEFSPQMSFRNYGSDFEHWVTNARAQLIKLAGEFPEKVPLNPRAESIENCEKFERRKIVFDSEKYMSVPCYVLVPHKKKNGEKLPAILCSHGHGKYGKEPVAGIRKLEGQKEEIKKMNYNYAEQMAEEGFVTLVPDLRGFGERKIGYEEKEECNCCNLNYIRGSLLNSYPLTLNIWDLKCCIDYLESMPEVDAERIGMMGLSLGGTMTAFTSALDTRIKAADIIGYINPILDFGIKRRNICGSQVLPGLYLYFDTHDIAGMIAPRPLLIEMGKKDDCFYFEDMQKGYREVAAIYHAAQADNRLYEDVHDGGHAFSGKRAAEFFKKYL